jgi:SWI/SNF-related matrix-associated actin-dependent regulator of chromatin subfamily B member 1
VTQLTCTRPFDRPTSTLSSTPFHPSPNSPRIMPSPAPSTTPAPGSSQNPSSTNPSDHADAVQNGVSDESATGDAQVAPGSAQAATDNDAIREGKEKAMRVMAASGVKVGSNGEQTSSSADHGDSPSAAGDGTNGTTTGRKRSRSGSRIPQQDPSHAKSPSGNLQQRLIGEYISRDQHYSVALNDQAERFQQLLAEKQNEQDYYVQLRPYRNAEPGSVFGHGYSGFGNGITDRRHVPHNVPPFLYSHQRKRAGNRRAREIRVTRKDMGKQAEQAEDLVPIRLDIELDKLKLRDTFTWNLHERTITPEQFAEHLIEDFQIPPENMQAVMQHVVREIREQMYDFHPHVFIQEEALDPHLPYHAYKNDEMRVLIKLNITIGQHTLMDQFEWDINNEMNSPEEFARQMARDLSLSGEFTTAIAHSIREQTQMFTKSLYITGHPFDGRPIEDADVRDNLLSSPIPSVFRPSQAAKDFAPALYELSEADLERAELSLMRDQRRQKRSVNRRGGPALPDLKDRPRTTRTLVVSSVLPGAAETLETSRLYKVSRVSGRGRRATMRTDGIDDSDESESEESAPDSPALPVQPLAGTARTRNLRGAASAAQASIKANLGRSATPEVAVTVPPERSSRRFAGSETREESVPEPTKLVVKLRISKDKYRRWMQNRKQGQSGALGVSQSNTPQRSSSAASSMPPPPSPAMQNQPPPSEGSSEAYPDGRIDTSYPPPGNPVS